MGETRFFFWRLMLWFWCWRHGAGDRAYAMQTDCWRDYFAYGVSPHEALMEDLSHAW